MNFYTYLISYFQPFKYIPQATRLPCRIFPKDLASGPIEQSAST